MKQRKPRKKDKVQSKFATMCFADPGKVDPETGYAAPTELGINEAKNWVDHNKK